MSISGNLVGMYSSIGKTVILVDADGNEVTGVVTENVKVFDATPEDVKIGKTFAGEEGVLEGTDTKTYRVIFASYLVFPGEIFSIPLVDYDSYNYTKFQATIALFNTTVLDSTSVDKTVINDAVYNVNSNVKLSDVTKNLGTKSVDLNIVNDTDNIYIVHYSTYKEE